MNNSNNNTTNDGFIKSLLVPAFVASILSILIGIVLVKEMHVNFEKLGPFGDFLAGSTVPVFTLVSFIGLILTLRMQKQQLEMQRQELQNSIVEMQETRKEIKEQGQTMALQRFESTFFNMLALHNEIVKSLVIEFGIESQGNDREGFLMVALEMQSRYKSLNAFDRLENVNSDLERIKIVYKVVFKDVEPQLGHYFRNLYRIVKFVHESQLSNKDKRNYIGIIKAQLSAYELVMLFYNGISEYGDKFLPLMKEYNLLDNLNEDLLKITTEDASIFRTYVKGKGN